MWKIIDRLLENGQRERALRRNLNELGDMLEAAETACRESERRQKELEQRNSRQEDLIARLNMDVANCKAQIVGLTRALSAKETDILLWQNRASNLRDIVLALDERTNTINSLECSQEGLK